MAFSAREILDSVEPGKVFKATLDPKTLRAMSHALHGVGLSFFVNKTTLIIYPGTGRDGLFNDPDFYECLDAKMTDYVEHESALMQIIDYIDSALKQGQRPASFPLGQDFNDSINYNLLEAIIYAILARKGLGDSISINHSGEGTLNLFTDGTLIENLRKSEALIDLVVKQSIDSRKVLEAVHKALRKFIELVKMALPSKNPEQCYIYDDIAKDEYTDKPTFNVRKIRFALDDGGEIDIDGNKLVKAALRDLLESVYSEYRQFSPPRNPVNYYLVYLYGLERRKVADENSTHQLLLELTIDPLIYAIEPSLDLTGCGLPTQDDIVERLEKGIQVAMEKLKGRVYRGINSRDDEKFGTLDKLALSRV